MVHIVMEMVMERWHILQSVSEDSRYPFLVILFATPDQGFAVRGPLHIPGDGDGGGDGDGKGDGNGEGDEDGDGDGDEDGDGDGDASYKCST